MENNSCQNTRLRWKTAKRVEEGAANLIETLTTQVPSSLVTDQHIIRQATAEEVEWLKNCKNYLYVYDDTYGYKAIIQSFYKIGNVINLVAGIYEMSQTLGYHLVITYMENNNEIDITCGEM